MEGFWTTALGGALGNVLSAILGIVVTGVTTMGGFYISKLSKKLKMDSLEKEIFRFVRWAEQAPRFALSDGQAKLYTVLENARLYAKENNISITDERLDIMVEAAVKVMKEAENPIWHSKDEVKEQIKEEIKEEALEECLDKPLGVLKPEEKQPAVKEEILAVG